MKKLIIIAISLLSYINAFCQEFVASEDKVVNYLMVSLAKEYLEKTQFNAADRNEADEIIIPQIKINSPTDCMQFDGLISVMKDHKHPGGAERLNSIKKEFSLDSVKWETACKDLKLSSEFSKQTWIAIIQKSQQKDKVETPTSSDVNWKNNIATRVDKLESKIDNSSSSLPIISFVLSLLSLLGVGYLYYMTIIKKDNDDKTDDDVVSNRINSAIKMLKDDFEFLDKRSKRIEDELKSMQSEFDELSKDLKKTQTVQNPPKQEEKQTPAPVKQETTQTVYARTKESGILREVNELSYYTLKIKNGRADVEFSGDSLTAIKNSNQYFDGVYDIADRNGSNKIEIIKIAKAEKQADGTWKVTEKGKLKFK